MDTDARRYAEQLQLLSGMAMLLQSCESETDLFDITYWYLPKLFSGISGSIYLSTGAKSPLACVFSWPDQEKAGPGGIPESCPALSGGIAVDVKKDRGQGCGGCGILCNPFKEGKNCFGVFCLGRTEADERLLEQYKGLAFITTEYLVLSISNIRLKNRLRESSFRDGLTGLYNRRYMNEIVLKEISRSRRSGEPIGMIMADIDHFKRFNDTFGHDAGDEVLKSVAKALADEMRPFDLVCRFGGEEFFILMTKCRYGDCLRRADQLRLKINTISIRWKGRPLGPVTASFGVAVFPDHGQTFEQVLKAADQALYLAKDSGRNRVAGA